MTDELRNELTTALATIVDTFSVASPEFIRFRCALDRWADRAANGDAGARELVEIVMRFARLVRTTKVVP